MNDRLESAAQDVQSRNTYHVSESELSHCAYEPQRVAGNLRNPRGIEQLADGSLLVAEAGTGDGADSRVIRLERSPDGYRFAEVVLDGLPSVSVLPDVKREEIMGASEIHCRGSNMLMMVVDCRAGVSRMLEVFPESGRVRHEWPGHVIDFAYDAVTDRDYAVSPDHDCIYALDAAGGSEVRANLSKMTRGQDPVPCAICPDPWSSSLLVTVLSGEVDSERVGGEIHPISTTGLNFLHGVAQVLALNPADGTVQVHVTGLTFATNALAHGPHLFVLEGCSAFLDPMVTEAHFRQPRHGGFRRFSGRLLHIDRRTGFASIVADELDLPSNLLMTNAGKILISQGAGTVGRPIPGPDGRAVPLEGFISEIDIQPLIAQ